MQVSRCGTLSRRPFLPISLQTKLRDNRSSAFIILFTKGNTLSVTDDLRPIKNIGPKTSAWLHEIGIHTFEEIEALGAVEVYKRLKAAFPHKVSLNALYGLQAAILNIHWNALPPDVKEDLKAQVQDW